MLAIAIEQGFDPVVLTFDYGQRHKIELEKGKKVLQQFSISESIVLRLDLDRIGGSALTSSIEVPKDRPNDSSIPITYVPGRNLIFLSYAAAVGEVRKAYHIFYGANILDYSGYPDCRPEFIHALETTLNLGTKTGVEDQSFRIHAPLLQLTKAEIIRKGVELAVDYTNTHSCYDPDPEGNACGHCDSCRIRLKGFADAGLADPASYR